MACRAVAMTHVSYDRLCSAVMCGMVSIIIVI